MKREKKRPDQEFLNWVAAFAEHGIFKEKYIAEAMGISLPLISKMSLGRTRPSLLTRDKARQALAALGAYQGNLDPRVRVFIGHLYRNNIRTYKEMHEFTGISRSTIQSMHQGLHVVNFATIAAMDTALQKLGISPAALYDF